MAEAPRSLEAEAATIYSLSDDRLLFYHWPGSPNYAVLILNGKLERLVIGEDFTATLDTIKRWGYRERK